MILSPGTLPASTGGIPSEKEKVSDAVPTKSKSEPLAIRNQSGGSLLPLRGSLLPPPQSSRVSSKAAVQQNGSETKSRSRPKSIMSRASRESYASFCSCRRRRSTNHSAGVTGDREIFRTQFAYVQEWFLRSSWVEKFHFLVLLVEESGNISFLKTLLQLLTAGNTKDLVYSTNQNVNAFYYDVLPEDDNRAMDYATLVRVQTDARYWFAQLVDSEKLELLTGLIALGGGALLREVYLHVSIVLVDKLDDDSAVGRCKSAEVVAKLSQRLGITVETARELSKEVDVVGDSITPTGVEAEIQSVGLDEDLEENKSQKKRPKSDSASSKKKKKKKGKEEKEQLQSEKEAAVEAVDKNAFTSEFGEKVELKAAETPGEHLLKMSLELFEKKMAETRLAFGLDENLRPIAEAKPAPKAKKAKAKKNNKSGSKKDKKKAEVVDEIQMLPLWANRPIMMQLDDEELAHKRKVSRYWAAMIDEVHREQFIREEIDETIEEYMQLIGPSTTRPNSPASQGSKSKGKKGKEKGGKKGEAKGGKKGGAKEKGKGKGKKGGGKKKGKGGGRKRPRLLSAEGEELETFQPEPALGEEATREMIGDALIAAEDPQMINIYQGRHCIAKLIQDFLHSRVMACCPSGRLMALSSRNRVVEFYSLLSGCRLTPRLVGHSGIITCMAFHHDGDHIMTGSLDTTVRLWNIWARRTVKIYLGHFGTISSLSLSKDCVATGGHDKTVKVYHIWSGQVLSTAHEDHTVTAIVMSPDTKLVYTGCRSGQLCAFEARTGERIHKVAAHEKGITRLFLSPPLLASAGKDGFARLWNTEPLGPSCLIAMDHGRAVTAVCISHLRVITGCESGRMRVWCALSGQLLKLMRVSPATRPIRDLHCIEEADHAKIVVSAETGVKIYEFDPLTAPKNKDGTFSHVVNVKPSYSKFLMDLNKMARTQFSPKPSYSRWQDARGTGVQSADEARVKSAIKLRSMRDPRSENVERRMCADPKARVQLDKCPIVTNTFFTKIVGKNTGTLFSEAPGELCEIFPRKKPVRTDKYRLPLRVPTWEEYCQNPKIPPPIERPVGGKKVQVKPSHKDLMRLYHMQRLSI